MSKNEYRSFFAECMPFLKLKYFCNQVGLSNATLSMFMRGNQFDYMISLDKLNDLYSAITCKLNEIA